MEITNLKMREKNKMKRIGAIVLSAVLALGLAVISPSGVRAATKKPEIICHRDGSGYPQKLSVTCERRTLCIGGAYEQQRVKLRVKVKPQKASQIVTYQSSNKKAATVSKTGEVTAKSVGKTIITITSKSNTKLKKKIEITVKKAPSTENEPYEGSAWKEDGVLCILGIGNSFTNDTMQYVYQIARNAGIKRVKLGILYIRRCSIDMHYMNAVQDLPVYQYRTNSNGVWHTEKSQKMSTALREEAWDFICFQQVSQDSGKAATYARLPELAGYVRKAAGPKPKFVFNMTWAYQSDSTNKGFEAYNRDQMTMYQEIVHTVQQMVVPNKDFVRVIPTGTAIQNIRTSFIGDTVTRDGYHLKKPFGRYVAGLTFFKALTGMDFGEKIYMPEGVSEGEKKMAVEAVENALKTPFEITPAQKEIKKSCFIRYRKNIARISTGLFR